MKFSNNRELSKMVRYLGYGVCSTALLSANAGAALAQENDVADEDQYTLEQVTVTAQKREESLQEAPLSVSAFTPAAIERTGVSDIARLAEMAPNVVFDTTAPISGASNAAAVTIRGVGQTDFALTTEAGVGTYIDGVYMSRSLGGVLDVLDIARLEILRGPQGTLFGRNTIGGAINIASQKPASEFGGQAEVTVGEFNRLDVRGAVDIPLTDTLQSRVSFSSKTRDGFVKSGFPGANVGALGLNAPATGLGDLGNQNRQAIRALFEWTPSPRFEALFAVDASRVRENNAANRLVGVTGVNGPADGPATFFHNTFDAPGLAAPLGFPDARYLPEYYVRNDDVFFGTAQPTGTELDGYGVSADFEYELADNLRIKSITAFRSTEGSFNRDGDGSPLPITETYNYGYEHEQFSQELQLIGELFDDRVEYILGAYFFTEEGSDPTFVNAPTSFGDVDIRQADIDNESVAVFGQANIAINDRLSATLGLRYTEDDKEFETEQFLLAGTMFGQIALGLPAGAIPAGTPIPLVPAGISTATFDNLSPRVSLDYQFNDNLLGYVSYSQGFKSGGFNLRYVAPRTEVLTFDPEELASIEAGFKFEGFDNRVRLNGAAYFSEYDDIQITFFENLGAPVTDNAGDAEIFGVELELTARPTKALRLQAGLGYTDAEYVSLNTLNGNISTPEQEIGFSNALPNTPELSATISADYLIDMPNSGEIELHADWRHVDDVQNDAQNSVFLFQEAYDVLNLGATYYHPNSDWSLRIFVDNATDERYITSGDSNYGLGFHQANFSRPREFGVTLRTKF